MIFLTVRVSDFYGRFGIMILTFAHTYPMYMHRFHFVEGPCQILMKSRLIQMG